VGEGEGGAAVEPAHEFLVLGWGPATRAGDDAGV